MKFTGSISWPANCFSSPPVSIFKLLRKFQCGYIESAGGILTKSYDQNVASKLFLGKLRVPSQPTIMSICLFIKKIMYSVNVC